MKYQTLILDFDGTLADTRESIVQTMKLVAQEMQIADISDTQIKALIGLPLQTTFERVFGLNEKEIPTAIALYRRHYNAIALHSISLFKNVKETLHKFHEQGITLTVASSKGKKALIEILKRHEIFQLFSFVGGEEDVENKKPAPDIVNLIIEKLNCSPKNCLVVGDTIFDIEMGQRAAVATCGVTYGNQTKEELQRQNPDYIIDDFKELLEICVE